MQDIQDVARVKVFKLSKPITAHGETVEELQINEPTGRDIRECGFPHRISADGINFNSSTVMAYIERLANIPPRSVDQITPKDIFDISLIIMDFFTTSHQI